MNLHKYEELAQVDQSLRQQIKKSYAHKQPPADSKSRLINAAADESSAKVSNLSIMISIGLYDNYYDELSIERVKRVAKLSLVGAIGIY